MSFKPKDLAANVLSNIIANLILMASGAFLSLMLYFINNNFELPEEDRTQIMVFLLKPNIRNINFLVQSILLFIIGFYGLKRALKIDKPIWRRSVFSLSLFFMGVCFYSLQTLTSITYNEGNLSFGNFVSVVSIILIIVTLIFRWKTVKDIFEIR